MICRATGMSRDDLLFNLLASFATCVVIRRDDCDLTMSVCVNVYVCLHYCAQRLLCLDSRNGEKSGSNVYVICNMYR
jgi:hypothetical protein